MRLATKEQELRRSVEFDIAGGLRERCEANPPQMGRPGRGGVPPVGGRDSGGGGRGAGRGGPGRAGGAGRGGGAPVGTGAYQDFAYTVDGQPTAADAPPLPTDREGTEASTYWTGGGFGRALVVPLASEGPCAFVLARIPPRPGEFRDQLQALALVVFSVLAAAWFAAGPVIPKLRRLADGVRQSAASRTPNRWRLKGRARWPRSRWPSTRPAGQARAHLMEVEAREEALRGFVANTTHDIAIPLTVLQGHLADLDRELAAEPEHRERVRAAMREAHFMASLLRNLGAAITLEESHAAVVCSPVDLSALVERVVARHRPIARAVGVELNMAVPDPPLAASSDLTLLEQALGNLVDNAIRYNHAGGHVAVLLDRAGDGFVLSVTDDGPGVKDDELAQLTTRWFRGSDARTRRPDGKGLGLAIRQRIGEAAGPDAGIRAARRGRVARADPRRRAGRRR